MNFKVRIDLLLPAFSFFFFFFSLMTGFFNWWLIYFVWLIQQSKRRIQNFKKKKNNDIVYSYLIMRRIFLFAKITKSLTFIFDFMKNQWLLLFHLQDQNSFFNTLGLHIFFWKKGPKHKESEVESLFFQLQKIGWLETKIFWTTWKCFYEMIGGWTRKIEKELFI